MWLGRGCGALVRLVKKARGPDGWGWDCVLKPTITVQMLYRVIILGVPGCNQWRAVPTILVRDDGGQGIEKVSA